MLPANRPSDDYPDIQPSGQHACPADVGLDVDANRMEGFREITCL
jgi:hypothetical protein